MIQILDRNITTRLNQHFITVVTQTPDEIERLSLGQWLAARDLDQPAAKVVHLLHYLSERNVFTAGESVFAVAPGTAHGTAGQAHEGARAAGMRGLSLNRTKDLGDTKHDQILDFRLANVD